MHCKPTLLSGLLLHFETGHPVEGVFVALDPGDGSGPWVLSEPSRGDGGFGLCLSESTLATLASRAAPHEFVAHLQFLQERDIIHTQTVRLTLADLARGEFPTPFRIHPVDRDGATFVVRGRVLEATGNGAEGLVVTAYSIDIPEERGLGRTQSTAEGIYELSYVLPIGSDGERTPMDLQVRVIDRDGQLLAISPVLFDVGEETSVDLFLGGKLQRAIDKTAYERLTAAVSKFTTLDALPGVGPGQLEVLSKRANVFPVDLASLIQATRISSQWSLPTPEVYALVREGLGPDFASILHASPARVAETLQRAYDDRRIPAPQTGDTPIEPLLETLQGLRIESALLPDGTTGTFADVLASTGLDDDTRRIVAELWAEGATPTDLLERVRNDTRVTPSNVEALDFTVSATALTASFLPALQGLQQRRNGGELGSFEDLARWDLRQWRAFVRTTGYPEIIQGNDDEQRTENFAHALSQAFELERPLEVLTRGLERDATPGTEGVAAFLSEQPDFDIRSTVVASYVAGMPAEVEPEVLDRVRHVQRIYALAPAFRKYDVTRTLLDIGVQSSAELVHLGRAAFLERAADRLEGVAPQVSGQALARQVYDRASLRNGISLALLTRYAPSASATQAFPTQFTSPTSGPVAATLASIFGTQGHCACEHCKSQFGPAAYLVDLLSQLQLAPAISESSALEALRRRRPDLTQLELSCENTNRPLPYIDLVNELLEQRVEGVDLHANQTTWRAEELRVHPEYVRAGAYVGPGSPREAVYPWSLPFDLPTEEMRRYLAILGVPRGALMRGFARDLPPPAEGFDPVDRADIVAESLGMTRRELQLISGSTAYQTSVVPSTTVSAAWGVASEDALPSRLSEVLDTTELSLAALTAVLRLSFVSTPLNPLSVQTRDGTPSCDPTDFDVIGLNAGNADRLHRFVRLLRKVPLSPAECNFTLVFLGGRVLDYRFLRSLSALLELMERTQLPLAEAIAMFRPLLVNGVGEEPSLYHSLFDSRTADGEPDPAFQLSDGAEAPVGEPVAHGAPIEAHGPAIRGALRLNESEFRQLVAELEVVTLSRDALSTLFRHSRLARVSGLTVADSLRAWGLLSVDPFEGPEALAAYLEAVESSMREASLAELDYVIRHRNPADFELSSDGVANVLATIDRGRQAVEDALPSEVDAAADLAAHLSALAPDPAVPVTVARLLRTPGSLGAGTRDDLIAAIAGLVEAPDTVANELAEVAEADAGENLLQRAALLNAHLSRAHRRRAEDALLAEVFASAFGTSGTSILRLARDFIVVEEDTSARDALLDGNATQRAAALTLVHKATLIATMSNIREDEYPWCFGDYSGTYGMVLSNLPISPTPSGGEPFAQWSAIALFRRLRELVGLTAGILTMARDAQGLDEALSVLASATGWSMDDLQWAVSSAWLDLGVADLLRPGTLARIADAIEFRRRTGAPLEQLSTWALGLPTTEEVRAVLLAARARYGEAQWAHVLTPVSDRIRERKRDALLSLLIARGNYPDLDAVYADLLVDPQMNACMMTSRVKLAISTCQLFVQRGLLGQEDEVVQFSNEFAQQWWRSRNYRVWEALRRVFFYPENWIEPELRLNKTPIFEAFEADLDQGELNEETVERAFRGYLTRLDEVANLETVSVFHEESHAGPETTRFSTVHVVGRTRAAPRKHFYRRRMLDLMWSPWQAIDQEIETDYITIAHFGGRVFLFWADLEPIPKGDTDDGHRDVPRYYRCRVHWSEQQPSGWTAKKTVACKEREWLPNRRDGMLMVRTSGESVVVDFMRYPPIPELSEMVSFWKLSYDCCLDEMVEIGFQNSSLARLGLPPSRRLDRQRQASIDVQPLHMLRGGGIETEVLSHIDRTFHVTQTHQESEYSGRTSAVYDDGRRSLYIVPFSISFGSLEGLVRVPEIDVNLTSAADREEPTNSTRTTPSTLPWAGQVPGLHQSGPSVASEAATAVLAVSEHIATSAAALQGGASGLGGADYSRAKYRLDNFNHPYVCLLLRRLRRDGIDGVLAGRRGLRRQRKVQRYIATDDPGPDEILATSHALLWTDPKDEFDFRFGSAYGQYNWELFFHVPLLVAERYRREQRFEEAIRWFHYIFDPRQSGDEGAPGQAERFWQTRPLFDEARSSPNDVIAELFGHGNALDATPAAVQSFVASIWAWLLDPLAPHGIAEVRSGTYRWVVVRKYLDTLIDWGDALFRRDTIESLGEATQLYMLASAILGPKPARMMATETPARTYDELAAPGLFGGLVALESVSVGTPLPPQLNPGFLDPDGDDELPPHPQPPSSLWWYFCLPPNDQLLAYWDKVSDRLFKIRNCQNIDGVRRDLSLFAPPIDPALLVRARASGVDLDRVLGDLYGPQPRHRYRALAARSLDVCNDVRALGGALLSALEKRDAEELATLRARHETALHERTRDVRRVQVEEARHQLSVLNAQTKVVEHRREYYDGRKKVSRREERHRKAMWAAMGLEIGAAASKVAAATIKLISAKREYISEGLTAIAETLSVGASIAQIAGSQALTQAGYERRADDWKFQAGQAERELAQLEKQSVAAELRIALAETERKNVESQLQDSKAVTEFLRTKYTNAQLYGWMLGQLSNLYFQSYKLAFDIAREAERALQRELRIDESFVSFDAWDELKQGLLAGERLTLDLRRMDAAHRARDHREYELTKRISLRQIDPGALVDLRGEGTCVFELPEVIFDLDHPGHYLRRIKSVSLTIPAVAGPHTSVGARLVLERHRMRLAPTIGAGYAEVEDDARFETGVGAAEAIATSTARDDSGLFRLNLDDERYLPFEGSGVISRWRLELPTSVRQFDYNTISDVEMSLSYTAREGGDALRDSVEATIVDALDAAAAQLETEAQQPEGLSLLLQASKDFAVDWERFLFHGDTPLDVLSLPLTLDRFPAALRRDTLTVRGVEVIPVPAFGTAPFGAERTVRVGPNVEAMQSMVLDQGDAPHGALGLEHAVTDHPWLLDLSGLEVIAAEDVADLVILVRFGLS